MFGFVFAEFEAAVHFHNPLSQFKLGAFQASGKLGLFVQVGIFWVARCGLRVENQRLKIKMQNYKVKIKKKLGLFFRGRRGRRVL
ncbi:MAG: hypothetical protein ACYSR5_12740 [Planctomycetota bacterium]